MIGPTPPPPFRPSDHPILTSILLIAYHLSSNIPQKQNHNESSIEVPVFLREVFLHSEVRLRMQALFLLDFLVVLSLKNSMVFLGVFQRVADQLHPQSLQLDLLDFLFL